MDKLRVFIAISLPAPIKRKVKEIQDILYSDKDMVKWVKPENTHITLKFLGSVEERKLGEIWRVVELSVSVRTTFPVKVEGVGCFPSTNRPRVVWLGIKASEDLSDIHSMIEDGLQNLGFSREQRGFDPHITIGRIKHIGVRGRFMQRLYRLKAFEIGRFYIRGVTLFRSDLSPKGPIYTRLKETRLKV